MQNGIAMMLSALIRTKSEEFFPPDDVVLALLSHEEAGCDSEARYLVDHHPERFEGVQYSIGEFGGFNLHLGGRRFYPIMVAEKQVCRLQVPAKGSNGHGPFFSKTIPWGPWADSSKPFTFGICLLT